MLNLANKKTIAVDIDDVLLASAQGFADYSNKKWDSNIAGDDYTEHWAVVWGVDEEEAKERARHIHDNISDIIKNYQQIEGAKPVLEKLTKKYKLIIVTSRRRAIEKDSLEWLGQHFENLFEEVHFAGMWDDPDKPLEHRITATKAEVLREVGSDYIIDDQPKHCIAAAEAGITALLFGDYRWNNNVKLLPNMVKVKNWQEVLEYFDEKG